MFLLRPSQEFLTLIKIKPEFIGWFDASLKTIILCHPFKSFINFC